MSEVLPEDRTTPQRPPGTQRDPSLERDKAVLRPVLDSERDVTIVLPRGTTGATLRPPRSALATALKPGVQLLEYRIDGVLGEGGFGITYLATDVHLDAAVAIKEYLPQDIVFRAGDGSVSPMSSEHRARYQQGLDGFLVEARTLASFRHRAIVRVARFFEANHTAYMVLEVEKGEPLKAWWLQHQHIGEKALVELLLPLLDGLAAVHKAGFLHRDIKPDNIQVRSSDGSLVLLDFGSASQTAAVASHGMVVVTPGYAPSEQYGLGEQGPWTDLYALGATLYWAISGGKKPPDAETRKADPKAYTRAVEAGRNVYGQTFLKAIDWALNTDATKRPRTVAEFRQALCADHPASLQRYEAARRRSQLNQVVQETADESASAERRAPARPRWLSVLTPGDWPLSAKLATGMLLAAVLPMVAVAWVNLRGSVEALVQAESRYLQQLATHSAADVAGFVVESRRLATALAADTAFASFLQRPSEPARPVLRDKLQRLVQAGAGVQAVMLLDAGGVAQASSDGHGVGLSHALRPYFVEALRGQSYTSGLQASNAAGATSVFSSHPVRADNGIVVGALVLRLSGDAVGRSVQRNATLDPRVTSFLLDGDGVVVNHPHADLRYRSLVALPPARQAEIRADQRYRRDEISPMGETALARAVQGLQQPGALSYDSAIGGRVVLAGVAPVAGHDWVVAVTQDRSSAISPLNFLHGYLLAGALAVAALVLLVAWWLARSVTRPLRRVTHALHDLKIGDYEDARVKADRPDELGQLGRAFNALSDQLRQRQRLQERQGQDGEPLP
ncbi:MAG: cache domain-containing protein [Rubrivivax sp.]|nr:cache domain-containing protein [Rubrivivax sp.]